MINSEAKNSSTLVLDVKDLAKVIGDVGLDSFVDELIATLRSAFQNFDPTKTESQIRSGFSYMNPGLGLVEWMPVHAVSDVVSVKTVGYHPDNPTVRNLPSVLATTALYNTTTGLLETICEATVLTALRTGAASAILTDELAKDGPICLGVVGSGAQAVTQIHSISRVRPISRIITTDTNLDNAKSLEKRLPADLGPVEVVSVEQFESLVSEMDVICTCTSVEPGAGPVVQIMDSKPSLHVNAVGSDFPGKTELPIEFLLGATVVPDSVEQCLIEGEAQMLSIDQLGPTMVEVLSDTGAHSNLKDQHTVFDSTGWSYEDLLAARLFAKHAGRMGLGTEVELTAISDDPYDPLAALS